MASGGVAGLHTIPVGTVVTCDLVGSGPLDERVAPMPGQRCPDTSSAGRPSTGGDSTLGLVDFAIVPHLYHPSMADNCLANAEKWAAGMPVPAYVSDDQTAIQVVDGAVNVVSEGHWRLIAHK